MPSLCHLTINQPALNCQFSPFQITAHFLHFSPLLILLRKATPHHTHTGTWSNYTLIGQPFALRRQHTFARVPSQGLFSLGFFFAYSTQERHLLDFRSHITTPAGRRRRAAFSLQQEEKIQTNYTSYFLNQNISISSINTFYIFFCCLEPYALRHWEKHSAHGCCCWRFALIACRTNRRTGRRRSALLLVDGNTWSSAGKHPN